MVFLEVFGFLKAYIKAIIFRGELPISPQLHLELELIFQSIDNNYGCGRHKITLDEKVNVMKSNEFWLWLNISKSITNFFTFAIAGMKFRKFPNKINVMAIKVLRSQKV